MKKYIYIALFINLLSVSDYCLSAASASSASSSSSESDEDVIRLRAVARSPYSFESTYQDAVKERKAGNFELALSLFETCLGSNSQEIYEKSLYNLGFTAAKMNKPELAYAFFSVAENLKSNISEKAKNSKKNLFDSGKLAIFYDDGNEVVKTKEPKYCTVEERLNKALKHSRNIHEKRYHIRSFLAEISGIYFKDEETYVESLIKASSSEFTWSVGKIIIEVGSINSISVCFRVSKDLFMTTGHSVQLFMENKEKAIGSVIIGDKKLSAIECWMLEKDAGVSMGLVDEKDYPFDCGLIYCPNLHEHPEIPILPIGYRSSIESLRDGSPLSEISYSHACVDAKLGKSMPSPRLRILDLEMGTSSLYGGHEGSKRYLSRLFTKESMGAAIMASGFKDRSSSFSGVSGAPVVNKDGQVVCIHARALPAISQDMTEYFLEKRLQLMHPHIMEFRDTVQSLVDAVR